MSDDTPNHDALQQRLDIVQGRLNAMQYRDTLMRAVQLKGDEQVALRYLAQVTPLTPTTCRHMLGASFADLLPILPVAGTGTGG